MLLDLALPALRALKGNVLISRAKAEKPINLRVIQKQARIPSKSRNKAQSVYVDSMALFRASREYVRKVVYSCHSDTF